MGAGSGLPLLCDRFLHSLKRVGWMTAESRMPPYALPAVHAPWMAKVLPGPVPQETRATCHDCAMCSRAPQPDSPYLYFDPQVKCCSYQPDLANFLVGGALANPDPAAAQGRASIVERIRRRDGVSPLGLRMTAEYRRRYDEKPSGFGRSAALRCPHFVVTEQGGHCGIWAYRPAVCTTYFCKHDRGAVGERFWTSLNEWLRTLEDELSSWCATRLGAPAAVVPPAEAAEAGSPSIGEAGGAADPAGYREAWGEWEGRELEYYEKCAELVRPLDWASLGRIVSPRVHQLSEVLADAYQELMSDRLPARLSAGKFSSDGTEDGRFRITSYSLFDPLHLSDRLFHAIPYFAGQPWQVAVASIEADFGFGIDRPLLRRMVDFGILVAGDGTAAGTG